MTMRPQHPPGSLIEERKRFLWIFTRTVKRENPDYKPPKYVGIQPSPPPPPKRA